MFPLLSILILSKSVPAFDRPHVDAVPERRQGIHALVADQPNGTAPATSSAAGSAEGGAFFATKRDTAVATVTSGNVNPGRVEELPFLVVFLFLTVLPFLLFENQLLFGLDGFFLVGVKDVVRFRTRSILRRSGGT